MKILLASDHAGFELKNKIFQFLKDESFEVEDMGAHILDKNDDYPKIILPVAMRIVADHSIKAIIFGKSGQGEAIICNRLPGIRAVVYYGKNPEVLKLSREHNDANILSIGASFIEEDEAREAIKLWISTPFSEDQRHIRRNDMLDTIE